MLSQKFLQQRKEIENLSFHVHLSANVVKHKYKKEKKVGDEIE